MERLKQKRIPFILNNENIVGGNSNADMLSISFFTTKSIEELEILEYYYEITVL